jgi:hypothetical protein
MMLEKTPKKKRSLASQTWNKKTFAMFEENTVFLYIFVPLERMIV